MTAASINGSGGTATALARQSIRVLLIDDHALFREGIAGILNCEPDLKIEHCASIRDALWPLSLRHFDLVLLDYDLLAERGSEFIPAARKIGYMGFVLVLTGWLSHAAARRLLQQGVNGIFLKRDDLDHLVSAIRTVSAGGFWIDPSFTKLANEPSTSPGVADPFFTEMQRQVLRLILEGLSNKEIGQHLQISESYTKAMIQKLFQKTGVRTRGQLARLAVERYGYHV
jgi:DNA-binding NarL/FixJ family response regulator